MRLQFTLASIVMGVILFSVYLLSLEKEFEWELYETEIAVALTVIAISVGFWGFKPVLQKAGVAITDFDERLEKRGNYDVKKLNNNIFRKLTRAEFMHDWYGELTFRIPTDENAFAPKSSGAFLHWMLESDNTRDYSPIKSVINDLNIGEKYLKSSYPKVYRQWEGIKKIVDEHNTDSVKLRSNLGIQFEKEFNQQFPDFLEEGKAKEKNLFNDVYILERIEELLYKYLSHNSKDENDSAFSRLTLKKSFSDDDYWLLSYGSLSPIMATKDKEKIDVEVVKKILIKIGTSEDIINQLGKINTITDSEQDKLREFKEKLEEEVVRDIDNSN